MNTLNTVMILNFGDMDIYNIRKCQFLFSFNKTKQIKSKGEGDLFIIYEDDGVHYSSAEDDYNDEVENNYGRVIVLMVLITALLMVWLVLVVDYNLSPLLPSCSTPLLSPLLPSCSTPLSPSLFFSAFFSAPLFTTTNIFIDFLIIQKYRMELYYIFPL